MRMVAMLYQVRRRLVFAAALLLSTASAAVSLADAADVPATNLWDGAHLASLRNAKLQKSARYKEVFKRLRKNADRALKQGPYSVMDKKEVAPSNDKHDYLSYARYWWPNPDTPDGLPYIRKDGRTNEDLLEKGDRETIGLLYDDVETLSLAAYLFNDKEYAEHAARLLRVWFLDAKTRMNPHMNFGQAIPGLNDGRGSGIIDTRHFIRVLDSISLLRATGGLSDEEHASLTAWMKQYLDWLRTDPKGKDESDGSNNHGTWYDAQVASIAMFVGEGDVARQIVEGAKTKRIAACIRPDGRQPEELDRTKGLHYSVFNLSAMSVLARIGEQLDVDLWNYKAKDGQSIRLALDFIMPYLLEEKKWPYEQIQEMSVSPNDMGLFYMAAVRYGEPRYVRALDEERRKPSEYEYVRLFFPAP
jgi:hypothetical protein